MSSFKNINFVEEFASRTKMNYLKLDRERILIKENVSNYELQRVEEEINELNNVMQKKQYADDGIYEITQLINSLIGLLVFPQQEFFDGIYRSRGFDELPYLERYVENVIKLGIECCYINTYYQKNKMNGIVKYPEDNKPANILRHMRNSVCHDRVMIQPKTISGSRDIEYIIFEDKEWICENSIENFCKTKTVLKKDNFKEMLNKGWKLEEFRISIKVSDLKEVLFEIADFILDADQRG